MAREYFGTDGVRGVVGETITVELVERLGKAAAAWCGRGRVFIGRDTRASGPELEDAFAQGVASAGGSAVLAGVLPTPLFDTQVAAMVCGYGEQVSYSDLAQSVCNVAIDKSSRFTDWGRRPLAEAQIDYAIGAVAENVQRLRQLSSLAS